MPARVWRAARMAPNGATAAARRIEAPALILWGDQDTFATRAEQNVLLAALPRARLVVYPGGGHAPHWEEPARVAADIAAFVMEIAGRASTPPG